MKLLHIDSSILGQQSVSRELGAAWVRHWREQNPGAEVRYRDLASNPLAHLTGEVFSARTNYNAERVPELQYQIDADRSALAEFVAADVVVIGAPMYNFSLPSHLKAWIDRIMVAGTTFKYGPTGPVGLLQGKKIVVISSRGGVYSAGPAAALDHQESYLRSIFNFTGITDVEFIRAEGLSMGPEKRAESIDAAHRSITAAPLAAAA